MCSSSSDETGKYVMCNDFGMIKQEVGIITSINHPNAYIDYDSCNIKLYNDRTDCVSHSLYHYRH